MIKLLLHKTKDYSMTNGVVFTDKSYKFDTLFVATKFLYEYISGDILKLTKDNKTNITNKIIDLFKLNSQGDGSKNYLSETLCFYKNAKIIEEINDTKSDVSEFKINDLFLLDFITVSIENSYIFQYLVVYQTFLNDGILNLYSKYCNCYEIEEKEKILDEISSLVQEKAKNVGDKNTKWAKNVVKFPLMILGLANDEKFVSRELNIEDKNIIPENLSANAKGTKSNSEKDNFYIHDFKINFVKEFLKELLLKDKKTFDRKKGGENVILYGVPGAGKSWTVNNEYTKNKGLVI